MGVLLAPYNTAMRLGQGFNSYTQEIMIDDAVVIYDDQPYNVITNDGLTMKQLAMVMAQEDTYAVQEIKKEQAEPKRSDQPHDEHASHAGTGDSQGSPNPKDHEQDQHAKSRRAIAPTQVEPDIVSLDSSSTGIDHPSSSPEVLPSAERSGSTAGPAPTFQTFRRDAAPTETVTPKKEGKELTEDEKKKEKAERVKKNNEKQAQLRAKRAASTQAWTQQELEAQNPWLKEKPEPASSGTAGAGSRPKYQYVSKSKRGLSQIVTYTSKFVEKLSDVTEDMRISGAFSVKYGTIGGSARGSFIDVRKFRESDLNFYISVKVANQSVNLRDALQLNEVIDLPQQDFAKHFGDSFISGFVEGGEFNALVSMKVMNSSTRTQLAAEAKVALSVGGAGIEGEVNFNSTKSNLSNSAETTIQVSWCGGGHIKPMEQEWDIQTLTETAARFPDLVATAPQRTYAIITKYEHLRSFLVARPNFTRLQYELAKVYTDQLMDTFMNYKSLYTELLNDMDDVQSGLKGFENPAPPDSSVKPPGILTKDPLKSQEEFDLAHPKDPPKPGENNEPEGETLSPLYHFSVLLTRTFDSSVEGSGTKEHPVALASKKNRKGAVDPWASEPPEFIHDDKLFPASVRGLEWARRVVRYQMISIVNEVDWIAKDPRLAVATDRKEVFQSCFFFRSRLPKVKSMEPEPDVFLGVSGDDKTIPLPLVEKYIPENDADNIPIEPREYESVMVKDIMSIHPHLTRAIRISPLCGAPASANKKGYFNNLDFVRPDFQLKSIKCVFTYGALSGIALKYYNGLMLVLGDIGATSVEPNAKEANTITDLGLKGRIISVRIHVNSPRPEPKPATGADPTKAPERIVALYMSTAKGETFRAQPSDDDAKANNMLRGDTDQIYYYRCPYTTGNLLGFWGRVRTEFPTTNTGQLAFDKLGLVWGNPSYKKTSAGDQPATPAKS